MYQIGICDDDTMYIKYIERLLCEEGIDAEFHEYFSGEELICGMKDKSELDLLILDIKLPGMDGDEAAKEFRAHFPNTVLVFCSGVYTPTVESFKATPYRYWLKGYSEKKMRQEIKEVYKKVAQITVETPSIVVRQAGQLIRLYLDSIYYAAIAKKGTKFYGREGDEIYSLPQKLSEVYEQLKDFGFVYAHNSYIVNLKYVVVANSKELELENGKKLTVSRARAKEFLKSFANDLARKY